MYYVKKEKIKQLSIIKTFPECLTLIMLQMKTKKKHNPEWSETPDHPYQILIIGGSASGKTNALLNLTNNDLYIDKTYLYAKDQYESKYQLLINKRVNAGLMYFNDSKAFIEFSNDMDDTYKNFEEYSPNKKRNLIVTELFIR